MGSCVQLHSSGIELAVGGLVQLVNMQAELQKQMTVMVSVPVVKEGKRLEGAFGFFHITDL